MADALAQQLVEAKRHLIGSPRLEPPPPIATAGVTGGQPPPPSSYEDVIIINPHARQRVFRTFAS